jgi:hypothetical protein
MNRDAPAKTVIDIRQAFAMVSPLPTARMLKTTATRNPKPES